ncbi:unnamed protein product [Durusdinium trenchii]|uniref:Cytoplasmic n=2 Tax=Durusdinium trenchii TaxID=1381693 RepID=A0ABP0H984_9DINO
MPEAIEARLLKQDLQPRDRKRVQDAVNTYYNLHVKFNKDKSLTEEEKWTIFAKILKTKLDQHLGADWHVAIGNAMGYACKVRQKAMGVWKFGDGCVVLIWKSPGIEPAPETDADNVTEKVEAPKSKPLKAKVIFQSEEVSEIIDAVREELPTLGKDLKDEQVVATAVRKRLTAKFGTIWHVLTGSKFVVEVATNSRNHFCIEVGGMRLVGFQHEQLNTGLLSSLDFTRLLTTLPYLLMTLLCFAYMGLSSLCKDGVAVQQGSWMGHLREQLCHENWEMSLRTLGVIVIVSAFCTRTLPRFLPKS